MRERRDVRARRRNQARAGESCDRHRATIDPIVWAERLLAFHRVKEPAKKNQADHPEIEHCAEHVEGEANKNDLLGNGKLIRDVGAENSDRLGRNGKEKPTAIDPAIESRLGIDHHGGGEPRIKENDPETDREEPEREGDGIRPKPEMKFAAYHRGRRDDGQEAGPAVVAGEISEHASGMKKESAQLQAPDRDIGDEIDREKHAGDEREAEKSGTDRDDAGRHDKREVSRREVGQQAQWFGRPVNHDLAGRAIGKTEDNEVNEG